MKTVLFYGLRRSGNHGILNLFIQHYQNAVHLNDTVLSLDYYNLYKEIEISNVRCDRGYIGFKDADCVIISIENQYIDFHELSKFNYISGVYRVLLIRNPYHQLSSVWKVYNQSVQQLTKIRDLWIYYAELFLSEDSIQFIKIVYDLFYTNKTYRENILRKCAIDKKKVNISDFTVWGDSSYQNKDDARRMLGGLEDCVYSNDNTFVTIVTCDKRVDKLWNRIMELYSDNENVGCFCC